MKRVLLVTPQYEDPRQRFVGISCKMELLGQALVIPEPLQNRSVGGTLAKPVFVEIPLSSVSLINASYPQLVVQEQCCDGQRLKQVQRFYLRVFDGHGRNFRRDLHKGQEKEKPRTERGLPIICGSAPISSGSVQACKDRLGRR